MAKQRKGGRIGSIIRRTGKSPQWCREFLKDFGRFNELVARIVGCKIRQVDCGMALQVLRIEHQQLDEDNQRHAKALDEAFPIVETRKAPSVTEEDLKAIFG